MSTRRVPGGCGLAKGTGRPDDYDLVNEAGAKVHVERSQADTLLAQSGIGNYNLIDWRIQEILRSRGVFPSQRCGSRVPHRSQVPEAPFGKPRF